jgi:hypothetical protein
MESGSYLEFGSMSDCKLYGPHGELIRDVRPEGDAPILEPGENSVRFACSSPNGVAARALVTVSARGEPFRATR